MIRCPLGEDLLYFQTFDNYDATFTLMFIVNIIYKGISKDLSPDRNIKGKNEHLIFHSYLFNIILLHIKFTTYSWDEDGEIPLIHVLGLKL